MAKRRANGEGSIRKRSDGRWEGRYIAAHDENGKAIYKNVLGKTQAEVKEKLRTAIENSEKLDMTRIGTYTVGSWLQLWYEVYAAPNLRDNTRLYYENSMKNHILPRIGNIPLDKLQTIQVQKFYNELLRDGKVGNRKAGENNGLSPSVVHHVHMILNRCMEQAVSERLILTNPVKGCRVPKVVQKEMNTLPEELIGAYLREAEQRGLLALFYLELTTGLRRGEILALLWTDLDVEAKTIRITKQMSRVYGELKVCPPKTANGVRTLALTDRAVELLVEEHEKHPTNPYLFPSPRTGEMWDPDAFRHVHDRIIKAIGAGHVRLHDLRHTFATLSLKNGVDVKTLSAALGHFSAGFTLNTYTHATPQMKRDAAVKIGEVVDGRM